MDIWIWGYGCMVYDMGMDMEYDMGVLYGLRYGYMIWVY